MFFDKFIKYFNDITDKGKEFEIKILLDPRIKSKVVSKDDLLISLEKIKYLFNYFSSTYTNMENKQTINFINAWNKSSIIKELHFSNGEQMRNKKRIYIKRPILDPIFTSTDAFDMKFTLSIEDSEKNLQSDTSVYYNLIRYKQRFTFYHDKWNIDFTFVKETNQVDNTQLIKDTKDKLFKGITTIADVFNNEWIWTYADKIEIEFEYTGKTLAAEDITTVTEVFNKSNIFSKKFYGGSDVLQRISNIVNGSPVRDPTLKNILPNAIEINKRQYYEEILSHIDNFYLTEKIDGFRVLVFISDTISYYDTEMRLTNIKSGVAGETIIECEMVDNTFYMYDILMHNGTVVTNIEFNERLKIMNTINIESIVVKKFVKLSSDNYKNVIRDFYNRSDLDYKTDGLIFTSANSNYKSTKFYKWKPVENMSIDFVAKKCPPQILGIEPYDNKPNMILYILFCGISSKSYKKLNMTKMRSYNSMFSFTDKHYFPIQFSPSNNPNAYLYWHHINAEPIHNKVVELTRVNNEWKLLKIRHDRSHDMTRGYYGNDYRVAELIWMNYYNPLTMDILCMSKSEIENEFYFIKHDSQIHLTLRKFSNMVKSKVYDDIFNNTNNKWILDLGSGKGQDLFKYGKYKNTHVLFIDNNNDNISEIINRKYTYSYSKFHEPISIYVQNLDLIDSWKDNIIKIKNAGIPIIKMQTNIVCNFAIHYFMSNITEFINFVGALLPSKGRFIFTCLDGEKVFNLLKDNNGEWGDNKKYKIKALYDEKKFTGKDQKISILLPFTGNKMYTEHLVNLSIIDKLLKRQKIKLERQIPFNSYVSDYTDTIADDDMMYIDLLVVCIYVKL